MNRYGGILTLPETTTQQLEALIGRPPDPEADRRVLMAMCDTEVVAARRLAETLHTREGWRDTPLRNLLLGLDLVGSPGFLNRLSVRAMNCIVRAGIPSPSTLAAVTPASLRTLPEVGTVTAGEILVAVVREWASAYLGQADGRLTHGAPSPDGGAAGDLAVAFEELEAKRGFPLFVDRELNDERTTLQALAAERGVTRAAVQAGAKAMRRLLLKKNRDGTWPIRIAADDLRSRLGSVARPDDLRRAFAALDPDGQTLPEPVGHRRALLLWLCGYRVTDEWILEPEIESITDAVLEGLLRSGNTDLDVVCSHLARIQIREELQVPWILSRHGFRIIDGEVVPLP